MEGLEPSGRSLLLKVSILYVAITFNYINHIEISIPLAICTAQRSNKLILLLQEKISVMPSRRLRQLTKRTWPTASAWLKPTFGRMQLKRWLTSTSSCQLLREVPFAREPAHTTSRVMLRSIKIKSRTCMAKRPRACSKLLRPTSWQIQMPKYENSHVCVCPFFRLSLAVWLLPFLLPLGKFSILVTGKKTREYWSISSITLIVFDFVVIWLIVLKQFFSIVDVLVLFAKYIIKITMSSSVYFESMYRKFSLYIICFLTEHLNLWTFLLLPHFFFQMIIYWRAKNLPCWLCTHKLSFWKDFMFVKSNE